jgi:hypothetical protein
MNGLVHCSKIASLFDHLVGAGEQRRRDGEADGLVIDDHGLSVRSVITSRSGESLRRVIRVGTFSHSARI